MFAAKTGAIVESNENSVIPPVVDFIFGIDTQLGSGGTTYVLPLTDGVAYDFTVNWGDGNSDVINTSSAVDLSHNYATAGEYTVELAGTIPEITFGQSTDKDKVVSIKNWGTDPWFNLEGMFEDCTNLVGYSAFAPPILDVTTTSMARMFKGCTSFVANITSMNLTGITDLSGMFQGCVLYNGNMSSWDVSGVQLMTDLFNGCSALTDASGLENWVLTSCTSIARMCKDCVLFNCVVGGWNVTSSMLDMAEAFMNTSINTTFSTWDVSSVTTMDRMFSNAGSTASNFGVNSWDVSSVQSAFGFMEDHDMSTSQYNAILSVWGRLANVQTNVSISFGTSTFNGEQLVRRDFLELTKSWNIIDGGIDVMTMIAGAGSERSTGFQLGSYGNMSPRIYGQYRIDGIYTHRDSRRYNIFFTHSDKIAVWSSNNTFPSWTRIECIHQVGSNGSHPDVIFSASETPSNGYQLNGNAVALRPRSGREFVDGETYFVIVVAP